MSKDNLSFDFLSPEDFNTRTEEIIPDAWKQVQKISSFFSSIIKASGPDTFAPTSIVFNANKDIVGVFTCRPFEGRDDLYQALSELLFFPVTIGSQLFIVAADSNVKNPDTGDKLYDALNMTFVSPESCYIYTLPYTINEDNDVIFQYENSNMSSVAKEDSNGELSAAGDMVELFFIFSHVENRGPFTFDEVLAYYDDNEITYEIVNRDNLHSNKGSRMIFQG
jgi:hypothetical protein